MLEYSKDAKRSQRLRNYKAKFYSKTKMPSPGLNLLQQQIQKWRDAFASEQLSVMRMIQKENVTKIFDTRSIAPEKEVVLT